jgi:hypothetical protein
VVRECINVSWDRHRAAEPGPGSSRQFRGTLFQRAVQAFRANGCGLAEACWRSGRTTVRNARPEAATKLLAFQRVRGLTAQIPRLLLTTKAASTVTESRRGDARRRVKERAASRACETEKSPSNGDHINRPKAPGNPAKTKGSAAKTK